MAWCAVSPLMARYGHQEQWWRRQRRQWGKERIHKNDGIWGVFIVEVDGLVGSVVASVVVHVFGF